MATQRDGQLTRGTLGAGLRPRPHGTYAAIAGVLLLVAIIGVAGKPRRSSQPPLDLSKNGVHGVYNLRNRQGDLLLFNFRAVEPGVLYRGSRFPRSKQTRVKTSQGFEMMPVPYADDQLFKFFRSRDIRYIVTLEGITAYEQEKGYFDWWSKTTGFNITVLHLPRAGELITKRTDDKGAYGSLRAAAEFIEFMKAHPPERGAVYLHDDAGKDAAGIAVAAYELWRNQGRQDPQELWERVLARYMVSNVVIARDREAAGLAGGTVSCPGEAEPGFVCSRWLEAIRPDLERIAQL